MYARLTSMNYLIVILIVNEHGKSGTVCCFLANSSLSLYQLLIGLCFVYKYSNYSWAKFYEYIALSIALR